MDLCEAAEAGPVEAQGRELRAVQQRERAEQPERVQRLRARRRPVPGPGTLSARENRNGDSSCV